MIQCFNKKGIITTYVLVFGTLFLIMLGGLLSFILFQLRISAQKLAWHQSLQIAEAGINYYLWCLNNKVEARCQTAKDYYDPTGNLVGRFSLGITSTVICDKIIERKVVATGWTNKYPEIKRKISILYGRASVGKYSYLLNDNVWIGSDHRIKGPYHSNGGIRMDGPNQSTVSSAQERWSCTASFGCSPSSCPTGCTPTTTACLCPGVFTTANGNSSLFSFPVPRFPFERITIDLARIKELTKRKGLYFGPSGAHGYRIEINEDKLKVWKVESVNMLDGICTIVGAKIICDGEPCKSECPQCNEYNQCVVRDPAIRTERLIYNGSIPKSCGLIFFEDHLWVGREDTTSTIKGKITIASANLIDPNRKTNIWLQGNIDYTKKDDSDGLLLIAQNNLLIGLYSPNKMKLRGIFVAQEGFFGRNYYPCANYSPYCLRDKLEIYGSVISKGRVGTKWGSGGHVISGYRQRESYYDSNMIYHYPLFTPSVEPEFKILRWEEL